MRAFLVGIVLVAICGSSASGQATGFVQQVGFQNQYRPSGWTPLLVNLQSQISEPAEYQIQVRQEDLDRDRVVFRRDIVLNPQAQEQFWVYFLAQPGGLPDGNPADLSKVLDVRLCTKVGGKPLVKLNTTFTIQNIDPPRNAGFGSERGVKMVLCVTGGNAAPAAREFRGVAGVTEDVVMQLVAPTDLPENAIGYDAVDAVVWLDADSSRMTSGGSRRLAALTEYVRDGGRLVVSQTDVKAKTEALADLLPVETTDAAGDSLIDVRNRTDLWPIRELARYKVAGDTAPPDPQEAQDVRNLLAQQEAGWNRIEQEKKSFTVAFAKPKAGALGELWIDWKGDKSEWSPWLVRQPYGLGAVTWVAQDLGSGTITGPGSSGWAYVWDYVLGHRNTDMRVLAESDPQGKMAFQERATNLYRPNGAIDLGGALLSGMEHTGRAGGLIFLAGVFFVGYWLVAGPVSYLVLAGKKRTHLSWTIFGVSALVATLLTVGVVRLVLRGEAELHHVSLVRLTPAGKTEDGNTLSRAVIDSRIGLYIPRDYSTAGQGAPVRLLENDPQFVSYVTPFSLHPQHLSSKTEFPAYAEYEIPVRDNPLTEPVHIGVPYRRTLKKLQARWAGHLRGGVDVAPGPADQNKPRAVPSDKTRDVTDAAGKTTKLRNGYLNGVLVNRTGQDLAHVFVVFQHPESQTAGVLRDAVLYVPEWPKDATLDLGRRYNDADTFSVQGLAGTPIVPGGANRKTIKGHLGGVNGFEQHWYGNLRANNLGSDLMDDAKYEYLRAFPMLSLYDRLEPQTNDEATSRERVEVLRRAAREWDISEQVAAGQLVVLAQAGRPGVVAEESPLPFPIEVEGERVAGTGSTFYQFSLPLDRTELPPAWESEQDVPDDDGVRGDGPPDRPGPPPGVDDTPVESQ